MNKKIFILAFLFTIFLVLFGFAIFEFRVYQQNRDTFNSLKSDKSTDLIEKLGKHILLPSQTPTVGKVTDVEKLRQKSAFFKDAKNGDMVLIYPDRAIIYDSDKDKIINVGMIPKSQDVATKESDLVK